ncbi:neuron navigator 2-like isoform 2 [Cricetulus griseus]|uniref:Neuron navigator 2-like isoform 2 n=1 Tax=Cricetulus griseus TaxID=10029 RepID=A0A061I679_CRIGR|nr:neuron navigator 2-like isoform 2 [Cricetulus griseus]
MNCSFGTKLLTCGSGGSANDKIEDINGCPKNRSQMIENIDACLNFLAAKGINTQGLSAEEIRNGNLKAILGLFFSLSRYKQQQQQQPQKQHLSSSPLPPAGSQVAGAPSQCQAGIPQQQGLAAPQAPCQPLQPASHQQAKTQAEMQSSHWDKPRALHIVGKYSATDLYP